MLLVPTQVRPSSIQGLGLFSTAPIAKGTITWTFNPHFDLVFTVAQVEAMPPIQKALLRHHGYLSTALGKFVFCVDDARFWNHSSDCNNGEILLPGEIEASNVALRDIAAGEELTVDYRTFDGKDSDAGASWLTR
ncbi:MAG: SET domain-containing protein-lysine N-methyltransferase [Alphaproteobacteria bacterium]|nr:SET domain-containing protein-lysine N-methyltransferase [Alphaproteobacteria bacterium]